MAPTDRHAAANAQNILVAIGTVNGGGVHVYGIPQSLIELVTAHLRAAGDAHPILRAEATKGGYSDAAKARLVTRQGSYLLKWQAEHRPRLFTGEAYALERLREANVVRVPMVLAAADATPDLPGYVLEEWIGHRSTSEHLRRYGSRLGGRIAELHRCAVAERQPVPGYGFGYHGHDWGHPGPATWEADWVAFYGERLLRPRIERGRRHGHLSAALTARLETLLDRLDRLLGGMERKPSLLHGDLWAGNVVSDARGEPGLIDAPAFFGDRELELAYSEVFGRFPPAFYAAYREVWAPDPGYEERRDLYCIYYYLRDLGDPERHDVTPRIEAALRWYLGPS
jgi:fructosamine-3-kinase